jgi:hypothetical protein
MASILQRGAVVKTCVIKIGRYKTYKVRMEFDKEGEKRRRKTITVPTVLRLAFKNINRWCTGGGVAQGGVRSISLLHRTRESLSGHQSLR